MGTLGDLVFWRVFMVTLFSTVFGISCFQPVCYPLLCWFLSVHLVGHSIILTRLMRLSAWQWNCPRAFHWPSALVTPGINYPYYKTEQIVNQFSPLPGVFKPGACLVFWNWSCADSQYVCVFACVCVCVCVCVYVSAPEAINN